MSRIYKSQTGVNYQGSAKSRGFAPVTAVSDVKAAEEYGQARIQDAKIMGDEIIRNLTLQQNAEVLKMGVERTALSNQQVAEKNSLAGQQLIDQQGLKFNQQAETLLQNFSQTQDKASLGMAQLGERHSLASNQLIDKQGLETQQLKSKHELKSFQDRFIADMTIDAAKWRADVAGAQASLQKTSALVTGLISFANIGVKFAGQMADLQKQQEAQRQQDLQYEGLLGGIGLGEADFGGPVDLTPTEVEDSEVSAAIQNTETTAITKATEDLAQSDNPLAQKSALEARQSTLAMQLAPIRGNVYAARAMFPVALQQAIDSGTIRPGVQGLADAQAFTRQFAQAAGLLGADKKLLAEVFAPSVMGAISNAVVSKTNEYNEAIKKANQISVQSRVSDLSDGASSSNIGQSFEMARNEVMQGNIGLSDVKLATTYTLGEMLTNLVSEGKTQEISALRNHVYNPSTGRTLGQDYDHLFDKAEYDAQGRNLEIGNRHERVASMQQKALVDSFYAAKSPEDRQQIVETLLNSGTESGVKAGMELQAWGTNYDPQVAIKISRDFQNGVLPTQGGLDQLHRSGRINDQEYKYWSSRSNDSVVAQTLKPVVDGLKKDIRSTIIQNSGGKSDAFSGQLDARIDAAYDAIVESLTLEVANDPKVANDTPALRQRAIDAMKSVLSRPEYQASYDPNTNSIQFKSPLSKGYAIPQVAPGKEDYTSLAAEQIFSPASGIPRSSIQATKDIIVPRSTLKQDVDALMSGGRISNRTRLIAKNLNMSPRAFLDGQMKAHFGTGLAAVEALRQQEQQQQSQQPQGSSPVSPSANGKTRTVQMGRALLKEGYVIWQHPNFDIDRGYVPEGGARVAQRSYNSAHHHQEALDFPLSHNSEAKLDRLYRYFKANKERFGINELLWRTAGHDDHLHVSFHQ